MHVPRLDAGEQARRASARLDVGAYAPDIGRTTEIERELDAGAEKTARLDLRREDVRGTVRFAVGDDPNSLGPHAEQHGPWHGTVSRRCPHRAKIGRDLALAGGPVDSD